MTADPLLGAGGWADAAPTTEDAAAADDDDHFRREG